MILFSTSCINGAAATAVGDSVEFLCRRMNSMKALSGAGTWRRLE
jgi:hypothetical protein